MKKILTFITLLLISNPVFAAADCGLVSEITRPAAHIIMVIAPILLIVLGAVDYLGAVIANDEKGIRKATETFLKRLVICVIIMILPNLVNMVISFTNFNNLTSCL